ncbi:hypothetical protein ETD86_04655 [Nonomuraea turkmeniaca]|uniref:Uncharacterized protein n=1 Tax=Nonomuraea turkmeniaca TaxID=103838 RepID=A0A5S4FUI2_9ACTN|nr:hypothetical protein [Nonomuraea turkmeniaca]TMR24425.1 hypothetical protein ETD86_04655 [Nonomuraea turkmeniaca]
MTAEKQISILDQIPSAHEMPEQALPTLVGAKREGWSRRRILGLATGAAVATGLGVLDLLPWSKPRAAAAASYTAWSTCRGYVNASTVCTPSSALYSGNCSGSWHRNDGGSGTCYNFRYTHYATTCDGHNAWRWTGGSTTSTRRKCSDGWYEYNDCGGGRVSRFSICRTAI